MTPEERAVTCCPRYEDHAHGNLDAMGKCCEACQPICDAVREAVLAEREACAAVADAAIERWPDEPHPRCILRSLASEIRARPAP